ncbi:16949_t:CDS:2, partial [Gigaspora rosea]
VEGGIIFGLYGEELCRLILVVTGYGLVVVDLSDCNNPIAEIRDVHFGDGYLYIYCPFLVVLSF